MQKRKVAPPPQASRKKHRTGFERFVSGRNKIISYVISSQLWIEHLLIRSLHATLAKPQALFKKGRQPQFALLIDIAEACGTIASDVAEVLRKIGALRNKFAHRLAFDADAKEIEELQKAVRELDPPRHMSYVPVDERELAIMLAVVAATVELRAREVGAADIDVAE